MEISELAKNISIIIGALTLISGIRAWKREYIDKRKIELAEDTLMLFTKRGMPSVRSVIHLGELARAILDKKLIMKQIVKRNC